MSNLIAGQGSCLCGAVHISAKTMTIKAGACHCSMCQKWAGGPLLMVDYETQNMTGAEVFAMFAPVTES
jgi:hypothetical protein